MICTNYYNAVIKSFLLKNGVGTEHKMNILLYCGSSHLDVLNDLKCILEKKGHKVTKLVLNFNSYFYDPVFEQTVKEKVTDSRSDAIFTMNYYPVMTKICDEIHIPYISWIWDSPLATLYYDIVCKKCNYIFLFDKATYYEFKEYGVDTVYYLPLGINADRLYNVNLTSKDMERFSSDVSIMSSLYNNSLYNDIHNLPPYLAGYFDGVINAQINVFGYNFLEDSLTPDIVAEFKKYVKYDYGEQFFMSDEKVISDVFLSTKCAEIERIRLINELGKEFNVTLYTGSDTSKINNVKLGGYLDYELEMSKMFKVSKININTTKRSIKTGIPLRVLDILGSGGFVISNYQSEIVEYFVPDEEIVVYESIPDLKNKISYYLENDEKRMEIAHKGYLKVKEQFNYEVRLEQIFKIVFCG